MKNTEIKTLRKSLGMTQEQFAEAVGVSKSAIEKWENGTRMPGKRSIRDIRRIMP